VTRVQVTTAIAAEPASVFDLELDVDVHAASLEGTSETASTSSGGRILGPGDDVTFSARHLGLWWTMTSRVTVHERPGFFVDEQTDGPIARMRHEHLFLAIGPGRTLMHDRVDVELPGGPAGSLVAQFFVAPYLRRLLRRRGRAVKLLAEGRVGRTC
jgi:ligand-binding SRPBCC domain-containing protein